MKCRSCGRTDKFVEILDLGYHAWCNNFLDEKDLGDEETYPLRLIYCYNCDMLQLDYTVPKNVMFSNHSYLSGSSKPLLDHFYNLAQENKEQFNLDSHSCILDIGGNDGSQLLQYQKLGFKNLFNVESAKNIADISTNTGIKTYNTFFDDMFAYKEFLPCSFKLINASGVFFHLEDLHSVIKAIKYLLKDDGVFICQFMYAGMMIEKQTYDMVYLEHILYYTLNSLEKLLKPYGLTIFDASFNNIHSGSIIAKISHSKSHLAENKTEQYYHTKENDKKYNLDAFIEFGQNIVINRFKLQTFLSDLKAQGKKIYGMGSPAKGNTLLTYEKLTPYIDKLVEINDLKVGKYTPVTHIKIEKESKEDLPDYYLLLSHNFSDYIIEQNKDIIAKGVKFIHPFPPRIIC